MKNFSVQYQSHIASGATTLATCWLIGRKDGVELGFTDHDRPIAFNGKTFDPAKGLDGSEVTAKLGSQVDTSEVVGILNSVAITEDDILLGRYEGASVTTFSVNWRDPSVWATLRIDTIGEITREDGFFRAELRSRQQTLNIPGGRRYQVLCDAVLGDARCGVDLETPANRFSASVSAVSGRFSLEMSGLGAVAPGWFSRGKTVWTTGKRAGKTDIIIAHKVSGTKVTLSFEEPVGDWVVPNDQLLVYSGCDRQFSTCKNKFSNGVNFQGFPHIPGSDFVLSYPRSGDALNGSALVK